MLRRKVSYGSDAHWLPLSTGNYGRRGSCCGNTHRLPLPTGNCWRKVSCCGDALWSTIPTGNFTPEHFDSGSLSFSTLRRQKKPVGGETDRFLERGQIIIKKIQGKNDKNQRTSFSSLGSYISFHHGDLNRGNYLLCFQLTIGQLMYILYHLFPKLQALFHIFFEIFM